MAERAWVTLLLVLFVAVMVSLHTIKRYSSVDVQSIASKSRDDRPPLAHFHDRDVYYVVVSFPNMTELNTFMLKTFASE
jgi:hypothetical protein